jgi:hypothetical protein
MGGSHVRPPSRLRCAAKWGKRVVATTAPLAVAVIDGRYQGNRPIAAGSHVRPPSLDCSFHMYGSLNGRQMAISTFSRASAKRVSPPVPASACQKFPVGIGAPGGLLLELHRTGSDYVRPSSSLRTAKVVAMVRNSAEARPGFSDRA